jgi:hypothetical protein
MKSKPDIDPFKLKKDPSAFIEGATAEIADRTKKNKRSISTPRVQKVFRLPLDLTHALKRESTERSVQTGARVTETELVEQALRAFFTR